MGGGAGARVQQHPLLCAWVLRELHWAAVDEPGAQESAGDTGGAVSELR